MPKAKKKISPKKKAATKKAPAKKSAAAKTSMTTKKTVAKKKTTAKTAKKSPVKKAVKKATTSKATPKAKGTVRKIQKSTASRISGSGDLQLNGFTPYKIKKGEDYMNETQVTHFNELLLTWKKELMEEVDRTVHHMQDEAANFPDPNDRATQESEFSLELRARDRERKLIKKIDESIVNLENHEYGYCDSCGIEIGIRRLEARPTANQCIDCKTLDEIREKAMS